MDIIFFVPIGLILVFALCILGGVYSLLQSLSKILFNVCAFIFFVYGIVIVIKGIVKAKNEKGLWYGISETIRGIFVSLACLVVNYFLDIGSGGNSFKNAEYVLLGEFETLDIYVAALLISAILILIVSLPVMLIRKKFSKILTPILTTCLIIVSSIGIYKIGLTSQFNNYYDKINWNSPEYEVIHDTSIKQEEFVFSPLKTGVFKRGTQLYTNGSERSFGSTEHYLVTDGKKMGYVLSEDVKSLVTYSYIVNTDADLYGIETQKMTAYNTDGERKEVTITMPSSNVVAKVKNGTVVTKIGTHAEKLQVVKIMVRLPDGTEGYIDVEKITENRQ